MPVDDENTYIQGAQYAANAIYQGIKSPVIASGSKLLQSTQTGLNYMEAFSSAAGWGSWGKFRYKAHDKKSKLYQYSFEAEHAIYDALSGYYVYNASLAESEKRLADHNDTRAAAFNSFLNKRELLTPAVADILKTHLSVLTEDGEALVQFKEQQLMERATTSNVTIDRVHQYIIGAEKALVKQHEADLNQINELFNNPAFITALNNKGGLVTEDKIEALKTALLNDLISSHKKAYTSYTNDSAKDLDTQHQKARLESDKVNYLAHYYRSSADSNKKREMEQLVLKLEAEAAARNAAANPDPRQSQLTLVSQASSTSKDYLPRFTAAMYDKSYGLSKTMNGLEIRRQGNNYELQLPRRTPCGPVLYNIGKYFGLDLGNISYYQSLDDNVKVDLIGFAQRIKADGFGKITTEITHSNKEYALSIALIAYEANRHAGFPEENITITINGQKVPLYTQEPSAKGVVPETPRIVGLFAHKNDPIKIAIDDKAAIREQARPKVSSDIYKTHSQELRERNKTESKNEVENEEQLAPKPSRGPSA